MNNSLISKKADLDHQIAASKKSRTNRLEALKNWILQANKAGKWVLDENWLRTKAILQNVDSNRLLCAQPLTVSFKKPWNLLPNTKPLFARCKPRPEIMFSLPQAFHDDPIRACGGR